MQRYYFDVNAAAPILPSVADFVIALLHSESGANDGANNNPANNLVSNHYGNPSSTHREGQRSFHLIEQARRSISDYFASDDFSYEVIFTSGASEANNLWLHQIAKDDLLLLSETEHPSLLEPAYQRKKSGGLVKFLPVDRTGHIIMDRLAQYLEQGKAAELRLWVSVQAANSESGVLQDIAAIAKLAHAYGAHYHIDAVQALGKSMLDFTEAAADFLTLSAHKIGGMAGAGALLCKRDTAISDFKPQIYGGMQEGRKRAGTENYIAIAAFARAITWLAQRDDTDYHKMLKMRQMIEAELTSDGAEIIAKDAPRLANTIFVLHPVLEAQQILIALDLAGIAVSAGSACASGKIGISHVLQAMGYDESTARRAVRLSFSPDINQDAAAYLCKIWRGLKQ